jgi:hypothetical protein
MASNLDAILERYSQPPAEAWRGVTTGTGRLGAARVRDSARRRWTVVAHREPGRGRFLVVSPVHGDNEPFRATADGYRTDTHLRISADEWALLALLVFGHDGGDEGTADEELRAEAFRLVDRMVVDAQHQLLMGAAEDEDD